MITRLRRIPTCSTNPSCFGLAALGAALVVGASARAQEGEIGAEVSNLYFPDKGVVFKLTPQSTYRDGCIDSPCDCAVRDADRLVGTMRVQRPEFLGTVVRFPITDVRWWAVFPEGEEVSIEGEGEFNAIAGFAGCIRELKLNLSINGAEPIEVSGLFNVEECRLNLRLFPIGGDIDDCVGVRIRVDAVPVLPRVRCFALTDDSFFGEGCFGDQCACPVVGGPLRGRFGLVELDEWDGMKHFAVVRMRLAASADGQDPFRTYAGFGRYRVGLTGKGPTQRMRLWLLENGETPVDFDSGVVPLDPETPGVNIDLFDLPPNDCFNTQLRIRAARCPLCPDMSGDGTVDFADLTMVLAHWGETYLEGYGPGDADESGDVAFGDLTMILGHWRARCEE